MQFSPAQLSTDAIVTGAVVTGAVVHWYSCSLVQLSTGAVILSQTKMWNNDEYLDFEFKTKKRPTFINFTNKMPDFVRFLSALTLKIRNFGQDLKSPTFLSSAD